MPKKKKRQDIDTLMIAKTDVGKIQCRHDAEKIIQKHN